MATIPNLELWIFNIVMMILVMCLCGFVVYFYIYTKSTQNDIREAVNKANYLNSEANKMDRRYEDILDVSVQNQYKSKNMEQQKADTIYVDTNITKVSNELKDTSEKMDMKYSMMVTDWYEYQDVMDKAHLDLKDNMDSQFGKLRVDIKKLNSLYRDNLVKANSFVLDETSEMIRTAFTYANSNINNVRDATASNTGNIARVNNILFSSIDSLRNDYRKGDTTLDGKISTLSNNLSRFMNTTTTDINTKIAAASNNLTQYINNSVDNMRSMKNNFVGPITICNGNSSGCKMLKVDGNQMYVCDGTGFNCTALNS